MTNFDFASQFQQRKEIGFKLKFKIAIIVFAIINFMVLILPKSPKLKLYSPLPQSSFQAFNLDHFNYQEGGFNFIF